MTELRDLVHRDSQSCLRGDRDRRHPLLVIDPHPHPQEMQFHDTPSEEGMSEPAGRQYIVTLEVNGAPQSPLTVPSQWGIVKQTVPVTVWRSGLNRIRLRFSRATRPRDVGVSNDDRLRSAAVDYIRVEVAR